MYKQKELNDDKELNIYESFLPEISSILGISVSAIEQYPEKLKKDLCQTYINNYRSDIAFLKQSLLKVIVLFATFTTPCEKNKKIFVKKVILETSKKISESYSNKKTENTEEQRVKEI